MLASSSSKSKQKIWLSATSKFSWHVLTVFAVMVVVLTTYTNNTNVILDYQDNDKSRTYASKSSKEEPIRQISIIGERNSGTRWIISHLQDCFNHSLKVTGRLTRYKHWFQDEHLAGYLHDTLVIAQFRNPYDWVEATRMVPHHLPSHMYLEWQDFVTKPWTTERIGADLNITNFKDAICQQNFTYKEVNSCVENPLPKESFDHRLHFSEHQPFYELRHDGSGLPYNNILELRADKICNFLSTKGYEGVRDLWVTQYEFLQAKGTQGLLDAVFKFTKVPYKCDPVPMQVRRKRKLPRDFVEYLNQNVDWETEALVGYSQDFQQFLTIVKPKNETKS